MMKHLLVAVLACVVTVGASACSDSSDVGNDCPMEAPSSDAATSDGSQYPSIVEINTEFPCDSLTCVNTNGRHSYCSRECATDGNCPSAFECATVTAVGPLADRKYCVWRACRAQLECGDVSKYDCIEGNYGPLAAPGLCGPIGLNDDAQDTSSTSSSQ